MTTTWKLIGHDADLRIAEFRIDRNEEANLTYGEAKAKALEQLRDHIAPYLARIDELESDIFQVHGSLPPLKAWQLGYSDRLIVTSKSKKRAMELVDESRYSFDNRWSECDGDWWYRLAQEEAVWMENRSSTGLGNGTFHRGLKREEASAFLEEYISRYRDMSTFHLLSQVGQRRVDTLIAPFGTPYKIITNVQIYEWSQSTLNVECRIDDGFDVIWHPTITIERALPQFEMACAIDWRKEGF